jgi:transglutaminase-like putative cysteine protease
MPNIKAGTIIEYKYKITSPFFSNVDEFIFQNDIPINKLEARFEVPEYFNYRVNTKGYLAVNPVIESKRDRITFNDKSRSFVGGFSRTKTTFSSNNIDFSKNISTYSLSDIPALKEEPYVNNINNYRSSVKYELSFTKFPNSTINYYSTTWEDVIKIIYKDPSFGGELDKSSYYQDDINALIETISDPLNKTALIFNFVKSKVNWNGYYGKYTNDGVKNAYKTQSGNVAEINLMLTSMLRHAGLNANPVLVSTRSHGIPLFPTREGYNYVICGVEMNDNVILLDATSKYSAPNVLPFRTLNWQGRIIREQGSSTLINLYPDKKSQNTVSLSVNLNDSGDIEGKIRSIKTNHQALIYRESYIGTDKDQFLENLENKYGGMEINDFEVKNDSDLSKPIAETYEFSLENQADVIGGKIYISPLFFLCTTENPFKLENREFPVDFGYPTESNYRIRIKLPEGYKVEIKPEPIAFVLPNNLGAFKYNILTNEKTIQLLISTEINQSIIPPSYYKALKEYFNKLIEKEKEKIVLTKS